MVVRTQGFRQHVLNPGRLHHGAHATAGNHSGPRRCRTQQYPATAELADHFVRDRMLLNGNRDHRLPSRFGRFPDGLGNLVGFAKSITDLPLVVSGDDKRAKTEPATAFYDFRTSIDEHHFFSCVTSLTSVSRLIVAATTSYFRCHSLLKFQTARPSRLCQGLHLAVECKSPAVKHDRLDIFLHASFRQQSAYFFCRRHICVCTPVPAKRRLDG